MTRQPTCAARQRAKRAPTSNRPIVIPCTVILASPPKENGFFSIVPANAGTQGERLRLPWTPAFAGATARRVIRDEVTRLARAVEARLLQELIGLRRHRLDRLGDLGGVAVEAGVDIGGDEFVGQLALDLVPRRQDGLDIEVHVLGPGDEDLGLPRLFEEPFPVDILPLR